MSVIAVCNRLITIVILIHCSTITIQIVNGQVCGDGIPTVQTRLCFDVPDSDPCSRMNNCRARAEFKPSASNVDGVEITLFGNLRNTGTRPWVRLHVSLEMNDEQYFTLFCDTSQLEVDKFKVGNGTDASIIVIGIPTTPFDIRCIFGVIPAKAVGSKTANSFDRSNEHYLKLSYGISDGTIETPEGTRSSNTKYRFAIPPPPSIQTNDGLSAGATAGIVIALAFLIVAVICAVVYLVWKPKKLTEQVIKPSDEQAIVNAESPADIPELLRSEYSASSAAN